MVAHTFFKNKSHHDSHFKNEIHLTVSDKREN